MRNYLFDTDVLISILRGKDLSFKRRLETLRAQKAGLWVSVISLGELYHGAFKSENDEPNELSLLHAPCSMPFAIRMNQRGYSGEIDLGFRQCPAFPTNCRYIRPAEV
jgi:hypothetical protein